MVERRADGGDRGAGAVRQPWAFRSWVLGLLDDAVVLEPAEVRAEVVALARSDAWPRAPARAEAGREPAGPARPGAGRHAAPPPADPAAVADGAGRGAGGRGRRPLPGEPSSSSSTTSRWRRCCGLPPYVDEMIDLFVDDGVDPRRRAPPVHPAAAPDGPGGLLAAGRRSGRAAAAGRRPERAAGPGPRQGRGRARRCPVLRSTSPRLPFLDAARDAVDRRAPPGGRRTTWPPGVSGPSGSSTPMAVVGDRGRWYLLAVDHDGGGGALLPGRPHRGVAARRASPWRPAARRPRGPGLVGPVRRRGGRPAPHPAVGGVGDRALPGASARRRGRRPRGRAARAPASAGWSGCCCGWDRPRRSWTRRSCGEVGATAAARVLARYR